MEGYGRNTVDDFRNGFPARAFGTEVEYTHPNSVMWPISRRDSSTRLTDFINPERLVSFGRNAKTSAIINTGGEIYIDSSFEFASPECVTPQELVLHERMGEQVVAEMVANIAEYKDLDKIKVFKRGGYQKVAPKNIDRAPFSDSPIGYHENYTSMNSFVGHGFGENVSDMRKDFNARCLCDFLALRKLIDGAGMITTDHYSLSQKIPAINCTYYYPEHRLVGKPPFFQKSSRLEVRSGEHSKSDWTTEFTIGLTSLVIRLIEHGKYPKNLLLRDANEAVAELVRDPHASVILEQGCTMKGIDVLRGIVETADELGQHYPDQYPAYEQKAAQDFIDFYRDLQDVNLPNGNTKSLLRINWAARYDYFMRAGIEPDQFNASDPKQLAYDLIYDRIGEKDIARRVLSELGISALSVDINEPPETRAKPRVALARKAYNDHMLERVDWHEVRVKDDEKYILGGPLNTIVTRPSQIKKP